MRDGVATALGELNADGCLAALLGAGAMDAGGDGRTTLAGASTLLGEARKDGDLDETVGEESLGLTRSALDEASVCLGTRVDVDPPG